MVDVLENQMVKNVEWLFLRITDNKLLCGVQARSRTEFVDFREDYCS